MTTAVLMLSCGQAADLSSRWSGSNGRRWAIFASWSTRRQAGRANAADNPGNGGIDARYDELEAQLAPYREVPTQVRRVVAEWQPIAGPRYHVEGVGCMVKWSDRDGHR